MALGLTQCGSRLARSLPVQQAERDAAPYATAMFLRGGLQVSVIHSGLLVVFFYNIVFVVVNVGQIFLVLIAWRKVQLTYNTSFA